MYHRVEDAVRDADIAMYRAKSAGNGFVVFQPGLREAGDDRGREAA
jgi:hypothetical protein